MREASDNRGGFLRALGNEYIRRRYTVLFYTRLFTIVAVPVLSALELQGVLIELLLAANLLAAVMPVRLGRTRRILFVVLIAAWLARPLTVWLDHPVFSAMTLGIWTVI